MTKSIKLYGVREPDNDARLKVGIVGMECIILTVTKIFMDGGIPDEQAK